MSVSRRPLPQLLVKVLPYSGKGVPKKRYEGEKSAISEHSAIQSGSAPMEGRESRESPAVMPSHSVIIPTCNRAGWLPGAVRSALEQTVESLQVIVVDDGSTDDTPDVCRDLERQDGRVRVCRQPNAGLAAARNTGLQAAEGRWAAFLDDDDLLLPQALARLSAAAGDALAAVSWAQTFQSSRRAAPFEAAPALVAAYRGRAGRLVTTEHLPTYAPLRKFHADLARDLGRAARAAAEEHFDAKRMVAEIGAIYHELVDR